MNGDLKTIYDKISDIDTKLKIFHAENKKDINQLFRMKDKVDNLQCDFHSERLNWLMGSVKTLWAVLVSCGVVGIGIKILIGIR